MRKCDDCSILIEFNDFYNTSPNICKYCFKQRTRIRMKNRRVRFRKKLTSIKESTPCFDCGIQYKHYIMEYDHIANDKLMNVTHMLTGSRSWKSIENEIAKCQLVCANCHRTRTFERRRIIEND